MPATLCLIADPARAPLPEPLVIELARVLRADRRWLAPGTAAELTTDRPPDPATVRAVIGDTPIDAVIVPPGPRRKRLLLADMDSTMITIECIDELADFVGLKEDVAAVTRRAMNGEIPFGEALAGRVALLAGLPAGIVDEVIRERLRFTDGAAAVVRTMRAHGARTVLVSGGFTTFTRHVREVLGFDVDEANDLEMTGGRLTGRLIEPLRDAGSKLEALRRHAAELGVGPEAVVAVGDGANDLRMLQAAGLGVAFRAHARVEAQAPVAVRHGDLTALLYLQGFTSTELVT